MYFFNRCFDKNRLKALILWLLNNTDEDTTLEIVEKLKDLGFQYATKAGLSLSIDDLKIPPRKDWVVSEAGKLVDDTHQEYLRGRITSVESIQQLVDTWHRASEILKKEVIQHFQATDILNPVYMMAFSGARGNISQVRQLVGMRGLMADPQGQIIGFPIRSNFKEGLTVTEYMISCYGARKGLVDTALRTADAGYLTRRLVDVSQHVVVRIPTCATKKGIFLKDIKDSGKVLLSLKDRLIGRVLSADVLSSRSSNVQTEILSSSLPVRGGQRERGYRQQEETELGTPSLIGFRNQEISPSLATKLAYYHKKILVRSPLTCSAQSGICQMCYGWSLSEGRLVTLGEAVGIVAAQSIGEPGTQLTMRTFHTGGVFSGDVLDEIKAPFPSQVFFNRPLEGVLIRTPHGKIGFLTRNKGQIVCKKIFLSSSSLVQGKKGTQEKQGFAPLAQSGTVAMNREKNWNDKNSENSSYDSSILQQTGETTVFQIERSTILFVRHKENVPKDYLLAESSSLQSQTNERAEAKKIVFSDISGQVFFSQMVVGRMLDKDGQLICSSRDLGSIWILAGQSPETRFFLPFYKKGSHLVNQSTLIGRAHFGSFTFSSSPFDKFSILSPSQASLVPLGEVKRSGRASLDARTAKKEKFLIPPSSSISSLVKETRYKKERETKVSAKNLFSFKIGNICHIEKLGSFYILSGTPYSDPDKTKEKFLSDTIFFPKNSFLLHGDQNKEKTPNGFSERFFSSGKNNDFGAFLGEKKSFYRIESSPFLSSWKKLKNKLQRRTTLVSIPKMWRNLFFIWFSKRYAFKTGGKAWWESRYYNDLKGGSFLLSESSDFIFNDGHIFLNARSFSFEKSILKHNYTRKRDSKNLKNSNESLISPLKTKLFLLGMGTAHYNFDSSSFYEDNGFSDFKKRRTFFTPQTSFIAGDKTTKRRWVSKRFPLAFQYNLQGLEKREISLVSGWAVWENNFKNDKIKKEYFLQRKILNRLSQSKTFLFPQVSPFFPRFSSVRTYIPSLTEGGKYRQQREKDHLTPVPVFLNSKSKTEKNFSITFGTKIKKKKKEWKRNPFQIESLKKFEEFEKSKAVSKSSKVFLASLASEDARPRSSPPGKYEGARWPPLFTRSAAFEGVANESLLEKKLFDVPIKSFLFKQKKKDVLEKSLFWRNCFLSKIPCFPKRDEREASTILLKPKNPFHQISFYEKSFRNVTPFLKEFENLNLVFKYPEKTNLSSKKLVSLCFPPYAKRKGVRWPPLFTRSAAYEADKRKNQKNRISIKPGWIYIPKNSYRAVKLHKSYKPIGTGYWEGVEKSNFDPWTVQVECLPRIFPCSKIFCKDIKHPHFSKFFNLNLQTLPIGYGCEIRSSTNILEKNGKQFFSLAKESTTIKLSEIRISLWLQSFISFYSKKMCSKTFKILEPVIWKTLLKNIFLKRLIKSRLSIQILSNLKSRFSFLNENIQKTSSGDNFEIYLNSKEQKNKSGILFLLVADQIRDASHFSSFGEQRRGSMATPSKAALRVKRGGHRAPSYFPGEEERGRASTDARGGKNFQFQCVQAFDKRKRDQNKIPFSHHFLFLVRKIQITPLLSRKDEKRRFFKLGKAETFSQNLYKQKNPFPNFTENTFSNKKLKYQQFPSKLSRLASLIFTPNPKINKKSNCAGRDPSLSSILYEQKVKWKPFSSLCCLYPQESIYIRTLKEREQGQETKRRELKRSGTKFYKFSTPLRKPSKYSRSSFFHSIFPDANYFLTSIKSFNAISTDQYKIFGRWKKFYKKKKPSNGISILDIKVSKFSILSPKENGLISQSKDFLEQTQRENLKNFPKIDKSVLMETPTLVNGHQNGFPLKGYSIKSFFPSRKQTKNNKKSKFSIGKTKLSKFSIQHTNLGQFLIPKRKTIFYFYKALNLIKFIVYWDESTKKIPDGLKPNFKTSFQIDSHSGKVNLYFDFIPLEKFSFKTGTPSSFSIKTSPFSAIVPYKTEDKKEKGPTESLLSKDEGEILCKNSQTGLLASKETKTHALLTYERTYPFYPPLAGKEEEEKDINEVPPRGPGVAIEPLHTSLHTQSAKGTSEEIDLPMQDVEKFQNLNRKKSSCGPVLTKGDQYNLSIEQEKPIVSIGQLLHYGEEIASNIATAQPGQIIAIDKNKVSIRKGQAVLFYSGGVNHVSHGQFVAKNSPLLTLTYKKLITGDIVQGIPKIEQFFEAPVTKDGEPLSESLGLKLQQAFHRLRGSLSLPLAARQSVAEIQEFVVEGIQKVYLSQGVLISDKHIEIIVRQMTSKGKIIDGGNTGLLPGEYISLQRIESINLSTQGRRADYEPAILGITQASLDSESFISAASFQETTRVLSRDSLEGKTDFLRGLKERVVLGDLIQAGTGLDENLTYGLVMKEEKEKNSLMKFENKKNYDERSMPSAFFQDRKGSMNSKKAEVDHLENWIFRGRHSPEISLHGSDVDESEKLENYKFSDSIYNSFQSEGDAPRSSSFGGQQGVFESGSDIYGINESEWSSFLRNEKNDEKI
jgi:hypothetical protein